MTMDFQSAMETFAEAWVAANTKSVPAVDIRSQNQVMALTKGCKTPPPASAPLGIGVSSHDSTERVCTPAPPCSNASLDSTVSPLSVKDEFDHSNSASGKFLPVHCLVEVICHLEESRVVLQSPWKRRPLVEIDSYVIIPMGTPFQGLVQAALLRLGYSAACAATAKGSVVIKNWKALNFELISDDPLATVGDILGELTTVATLRIQVCRSRTGVLTDIKDKLLRFFLTQSQGLLATTGCPLDELVLSQICRVGSEGNGCLPEISEECRCKFEKWWTSQLGPLSPSNRTQASLNYGAQYQRPVLASKSTENALTDSARPAVQNVQNQFPTQKTRMRTSFDPELELPKLQRWFTENQHPNRQQIQQYVKELNNLESRRGRKPLDVNNVVYWFKNARAAQKRAEIRNVTPGLPCHVSSNGYSDHNTSNGSGILINDCYINSERPIDHTFKPSLPASYIRDFRRARLSDEFSNTTSDMEEDPPESQSHSPVEPLSLTTSNKRDSSENSPRNPTPLNAVDVQVETNKSEAKEEIANFHTTDHCNVNRVNAMDGDDNDEAAGKNVKGRLENSCNSTHISRPLPHKYCRTSDFENPAHSRAPATDSLERLAAGFPLIPNSMFSQSVMYMSHYIPGLSHSAPSPTNSGILGMTTLAADDRRKRNRTFIDPVTEVPRLEQWFSLTTHPSHNLILKYTEELNCMAYRQKFPRLEPKNVQFWFKNRRAKCKRLKMSLLENQSSIQYHHGDRE